MTEYLCHSLTHTHYRTTQSLPIQINFFFEIRYLSQTKPQTYRMHAYKTNSWGLIINCLYYMYIFGGYIIYQLLFVKIIIIWYFYHTKIVKNKMVKHKDNPLIYECFFLSLPFSSVKVVVVVVVLKQTNFFSVAVFYDFQCCFLIF